MAVTIPYINSLIEKFWYIVLSNRAGAPNFTDLLNLSESIVKADNPKNTKLLQRLTKIREKTHDEIDMPAASFEIWMVRNWAASINKELEFRDGKYLKLYEIARIVDAVIQELCDIVTKVGKNYSMAIKYGERDETSNESARFDYSAYVT